MKKVFAVVSLLLLITASLGYAQEQTQSAAMKTITLLPENAELKSAPGLDRVQINCLVCHSAEYILMQPKFTQAQWTGTVNKMIKVYGAKISVEDAKIIADYLAENYGSGKQ